MIHNPVLRKELLIRFRLRQPTPARIGIGLGLAVMVGWLYWLGMSWLLQEASPSTGAAVWALAISLQYMIVCMVAPSLTANAITQEKEQQTWEMLLFTRLRPAEIIMGKLYARLVSVWIIVAIFLPFTIFSWLHALGIGAVGSDTISPGRFLMAYVVIFVTAFFYATVGLYLSWQMKRTLYALIAAYVFVIGVLTIGTWLLYSIVGNFAGTYIQPQQNPLMWVNPSILMYGALAPQDEGALMAVIGGLAFYGVGTLALLGIMVAGFRRHSHE